MASNFCLIAWCALLGCSGAVQRALPCSLTLVVAWIAFSASQLLLWTLSTWLAQDAPPFCAAAEALHLPSYAIRAYTQARLWLLRHYVHISIRGLVKSSFKTYGLHLSHTSPRTHSSTLGPGPPTQHLSRVCIAGIALTASCVDQMNEGSPQSAERLQPQIQVRGPQDAHGEDLEFLRCKESLRIRTSRPLPQSSMQKKIV